MNRTDIEWVKNPDGSQGFTANPVKGKCPVDCSYCYVKPLRRRFGWHDDIRYYQRELVAIFKKQKPSGIFLGSTIELWHDDIPSQYQHAIMATIHSCPQHRFYVLTKCPQNLVKFSPFPDNCWVGVTVTGHEQSKSAMKGLRNIEASVKYFSFEPLLHRVGVNFYDFDDDISWVIIGAQTKPTIVPRIGDVKEIVKAADRAGIRVFLKDSIKSLLPIEDPLFYGDGKLRQEMPEMKRIRTQGVGHESHSSR